MFQVKPSGETSSWNYWKPLKAILIIRLWCSRWTPLKSSWTETLNFNKFFIFMNIIHWRIFKEEETTRLVLQEEVPHLNFRFWSSEYDRFNLLAWEHRKFSKTILLFLKWKNWTPVQKVSNLKFVSQNSIHKIRSSGAIRIHERG